MKVSFEKHPNLTLRLPHIKMILNIYVPQEEKMEVQEVFVVLTLAVFNVCWGVMASLPVTNFYHRQVI